MPAKWRHAAIIKGKRERQLSLPEAHLLCADSERSGAGEK